jgi:hypothetical protein
MNQKLSFSLFIMMWTFAGLAQDVVFEKSFKQSSTLFKKVISNLEQYEVQIIYSQIDRDQNGTPSLISHQFNVDKNRYFYPASTVKMPVACYALEKLNEMNDARITQNTPIAFGANLPPQYPFLVDTTAKNNQITLNHLIKKVFLVSDNEAYNMLYAFCGQEDINDRLRQKEYPNTKITSRVGAGAFTFADNACSNPYLFYQGDDILKMNPGQCNATSYADLRLDNCAKGNGYYRGKELIKQPFNFCDKNALPLPVLHDMLVSIVLPDAVSDSKQLNITNEQRRELLSMMSERPRESKYPSYDSEYYDSYVKYFMVGDRKEVMPTGLRIFNKVGCAYGYLIDVAYIVDLDQSLEFVLAAVIHVNENGIYNDDTYEYDEVGVPFLAELGRLFYQYEMTRTHTFDVKPLRKLVYD